MPPFLPSMELFSPVEYTLKGSLLQGKEIYPPFNKSVPNSQ